MKPRRVNSYQWLANGMPTAKIVPAMPKEPKQQQQRVGPDRSREPHGQGGNVETTDTAMNMARRQIGR